MYFRYKVIWNMDNKLHTDTGLVYVDPNPPDDTKFDLAMKKILEDFDGIESIFLEAFAPDGCLEVSEEALNAIQEHVMW